MFRRRTSCGRGGRRLGGAAALALFAGCPALVRPEVKPPPMAVPAAVALVSASAAPPLSFGRPSPDDLSTRATLAGKGALALRVRFVVLPQAPADLRSQPLDEDAQAIVDVRTGETRAGSDARGGRARPRRRDGRAAPRAPAGLAGRGPLGRPSGRHDGRGRAPRRASSAVPGLGSLGRAAASGPRRARARPDLGGCAATPPWSLDAGHGTAQWPAPGPTEFSPRAREQVALLVRKAGGHPRGSRAAGAPAQPRDVGPSVATPDFEIALDLESAAPPPPPAVPGGQGSPPATHGAPDRGRSSGREARSADAGSHELVALAPRAVSVPGQLAWVVPSPFSWGQAPAGAWIAIVLDVRPAPQVGQPGAAAHRSSLEAIAASLGAERERVARERPLPAPRLIAHRVDAVARDPEALFFTLAQDPLSRGTLVAIGSRTGATLVADAALTLPDALLPRLTNAVLAAQARTWAFRAAASALGGPGAAAVTRARPLGVALDRGALEALVSPEVRGVARVLLERRFGVALDDDLADPRRPFLRRATGVESGDDLERLVLSRNVAALDDSRPSVRVRAARWLLARHGDLMGYDPFGPFEERRAAIDRLWAAAVASGGGS